MSKDLHTPSHNVREIDKLLFIYLNGVGQILQMNVKTTWVLKDFVLFRYHLLWNIFRVRIYITISTFISVRPSDVWCLSVKLQFFIKFIDL